MSSRVLTPDVGGIDALVHDHQTVLAKAEGGVVAVFANNAPAFYAVTPGKNQPVRLQRTVDDYPVNQLSYSVIDCWCVIHRSLHYWIMVVPQAPSRIKLPRLKHTDERQPPFLRVLL